MEHTCSHYWFPVRSPWPETPLSSLSTVPHFFGCPHFCGHPPASASTLVPLWLCRHPHFFRELSTSASPPYLWLSSHTCECPRLLWAPRCRGTCSPECALWLGRPGILRAADFLLQSHWQPDQHSLMDPPCAGTVSECPAVGSHSPPPLCPSFSNALTALLFWPCCRWGGWPPPLHPSFSVPMEKDTTGFKIQSGRG